MEAVGVPDTRRLSDCPLESETESSQNGGQRWWTETGRCVGVKRGGRGQQDAASLRAEKMSQQHHRHLRFLLTCVIPSSLGCVCVSRQTSLPRSPSVAMTTARRGRQRGVAPLQSEQGRAGVVPRVSVRPLSWTPWRWPSWAAGCGSRGCETPAGGRGRCCTPAPGRTAAGPGWEASGGSSLCRTRYRSSYRKTNKNRWCYIFVFICVWADVLCDWRELH